MAQKKKDLNEAKNCWGYKIKKGLWKHFFGCGLGLEMFNVPHKTPSFKIMLSADNELKPVLPPSWILSPIDI